MENTNLIRKSRPPYLLGILCLIPLIGAFVGLGLLLYGLLKYKDKWLSLIGAFGIVFTILVYSILFYIGEHGAVFKQAWIVSSQKQLNTLVENIEFYKLQNGQYPDSLQQLIKNGEYIMICDPIQSTQKRKNIYYNYKRVGEKYLLFSSGEDGTPNTKDDLFPQITIKDSSKIGLIKP